MPDRAKYLALVLSLYLVAVAIVVTIVAAIFQRPFVDVTVNLAPAILIFLVVTIVHGVRHDLDS
ncbi:hypothetical protein ACT3SP_08540 [Brachybacterium sp. AOP43-C2-M15]|uniref:hypothetical protein n=1 Tax=Brachybacterium sp. AOP43-C2-M15 TaxID=3457661 RepID=UPI004033B790